jgi:DNA mismatch repair protein MSH6
LINNEDGDELIPEEGKDEEYDSIVEEISSLEKQLNKELKRLEKEVGCDCHTLNPWLC